MQEDNIDAPCSRRLMVARQSYTNCLEPQLQDIFLNAVSLS